MTKLVNLAVFVEDFATEESIASYADPIQDEIIAIPGVLGVSRTLSEGEGVDELLALAYAADLEDLGVATIPAIEAAETRFNIEVENLKAEIELEDLLADGVGEPDDDDDESAFRPPFDLGEMVDALLTAPDPPQRIAAPTATVITSDGFTNRQIEVEPSYPGSDRVLIKINEDPSLEPADWVEGLTLNEASRLALIKALGGHASPTNVEVTV